MPPEVLWRLAELSTANSPISRADRLDLEHAMQLLRQSKPESCDYLGKHFILGLPYADIAEEQNLTYNNVRMRVGRCLDEAQTLVS